MLNCNSFQNKHCIYFEQKREGKGSEEKTSAKFPETSPVQHSDGDSDDWVSMIAPDNHLITIIMKADCGYSGQNAGSRIPPCQECPRPGV